MNRFLIVLLALSLDACGGGSSGGGGTTPPTPTPVTHYTVALHWEPASSVGLATLFRRRAAIARLDSGAGTTVIAVSGNGGSGVYDTNYDPAYVTASVSPMPSPLTATFSTTSADAVVSPTPAPASPNPSASPAALVVPTQNNIAESGATVSVSANGASATDNLMIIKSLTMIISNGGYSSPQDFQAYTFDSSCNAVGQASTAGADIYLTGPISGTSEPENTMHYPNGGIALAHGYDVSTLAASDWQNAGTSIGLNTYAATDLDDTLIFKAANGKIVVFGGPGQSVIPGNGSSEAAIITGYTCLN